MDNDGSKTLVAPGMDELEGQLDALAAVREALVELVAERGKTR